MEVNRDNVFKTHSTKNSEYSHDRIACDNNSPEHIVWPQISQLTLAPELHALRLSGIGGSDANIILSGDGEALLRLWLEKREMAEPQDLSGHLPVMLGSWTEAFNRQWYERTTGYVVDHVGTTLVCPERSWRRCTLDGAVPLLNAVWEAKHTNAFMRSDEVVERYMPQLQHNMAVSGRSLAVLSVIFGNARWEIFEVASDWMYQEELLIAEARFWDCVRTGEMPVPAPVPAAPKPVGVREICLEGNNAWASAALDWIENREAAQVHAAATKELKALVEDDVKRAFGHGIEARRSRSGAITIRELGA